MSGTPGMLPDPLRDAIATALGAQYDVVRLLGRGGMGAVYLAHERLLDRPVAIKVLPHENAGAAEVRERFLREARTAAKLTHPHIVPLHSFGEAGQTLFYIMGYVEGESLEQRLRRQERLSFDEVRRILGELAAALEHAHAHGIVHRDLKPDNVLLEAGSGRAVLTDFGIARQNATDQSLTRTGMIMGTPHYMSPEQAAGEREIDGRSDLYALGVIGYRLLTGRLPFEGTSIQDVLVQHVTRSAVPVSAVRPDVPPDLDAAIARCLEKDPAKRLPSATRLREAVGSSDVELSLPPGFERLPASGANGLVAACGVSVAAGLLYIGSGKDTLLPMAGGLWLGALLWPAVAMVRGGRQGLRPRQLLRMAFWQPRWLGKLWWPRALRRPGDVWGQLPRVVRRVRGLNSLAYGLMGMLAPILAGGIFEIYDRSVWEVVVWPVLAILGATTLCIGIASGFTNVWSKRWNLTLADAGKLLSEPTWGSSFWKRAEIARLLEGGGATVARAPSNPAEILIALDQLAAVAPDGVRAVATDAAEVARQVVKAIGVLDDNIRALARDADPAERDRLRGRLATLDAGATATEPAGRMRELLESQLALVESLLTQVEAMTVRRDRYAEMLRVLWLRVADLRAHHAGAPGGDLTLRVRDVCQDAERALEAERGVADLLSAPHATPTPR